jgi:hypothetical protein
MRWKGVVGLAATLGLVSGAAMAEARWLVCKYNDTRRGQAQTFYMVFDDLRNLAALFDGGNLIEGTSTSINFQALRTRFPPFIITYNRNDGALAVTPTEGGLGGILSGECRRIPTPPNAPRL